MIKPVKTKAQIREEIENQIQAYLDLGGEVARFQPGHSGRDSNEPLPKPPHIERNPEPQARTPVLSEIQAIEARRQRKKAVPNRRRRRDSEKKTLLTDDFGEPLRWITE
ncbi:hypothetical protein [Pseudomaricurvus sp. HS19]|uniref:hypothetical protein n=1 Tax=Pseudomaricurvus sp. HS19 TaxID=2692626 RepID=UPI00136BE9C5|nr:hypothetical protein [Pseudomaricurvus sp. HS19]MYM64270.1 hypothetical protein [Pseudomaricurvus sp. HS19]